MAKMLSLALVSFVFTAGFATSAFAGRDGEQGICMDGSTRMQSYNNEQVLSWKKSTPNAWHGRGFVNGAVSEVVDSTPGHFRFVVKIGPKSSDLLEVVYNSAFGALPELRPGTPVAICGDFINAFERSGRYPPSPAGAIIHWVHGSNSKRHEDGFVAVNGTIFGQDGDARRGGRR
ncbi:MAG: DUF3465 domain-containing protein [Proteobacteria bacterium]|nr:MAG: DUF3465 domain-containing protein [Pseudomonadota bacterium]